MINKDKEFNFYFYGNPAGLGNRYEELARLSKFAVSKNIKIKYYWNNSFKFRYSNYFDAANIKIEQIDNLKVWPTKNFESTRYWREYISSQSITNKEYVSLNINQIKYIPKYIGIHVRGTDRILKGKNIPQGFQKPEDLEKSIEFTLKYLEDINNSLPIVVFSEDKSLKQKVEEILSNFEIISLPVIDNIEGAYQDLYHLSKAKEIIMCSKFSTYALSAASLGNGKIIHFFNNRVDELRLWDLEFKHYDPNSKNLPFSRENFELSSSYVGNRKIKSFKVNNETIRNTKILISFNTSTYLGFEEHFKLLNNTIKVYMCNSSILFIKFKEFLRILYKDKNRKTKLKNFITEFYKSFKIFNKNAIFFRKKTINIKLPYFVYINAVDINKIYNTYFESDFFEGAIIEFTNIEKSKELLESVLDMLTNQPYNIKFISQYNQHYLTILK